MSGDPRFHELLKTIGELHDLKQEDYGSDEDPFANVRASEDFGVKGWVGGVVRMNDKVTRLKQFAKKGTLANESVEDSLLDIMVYAGISLILYREESDADAKEDPRLYYVTPGAINPQPHYWDEFTCRTQGCVAIKAGGLWPADLGVYVIGPDSDE